MNVVKTLVLSQSLPPAKSGSAHIARALIEASNPDQVVFLGGKEPGREKSEPRPNVVRVTTDLSVFGRGARFLMLPRLLLFPILVIRLLATCRRHRVKRLVLVFPDAFFCTAGDLAARMLGIPYGMYFHNTYSPNRSGFFKRIAEYLERAWMERADAIYLISNGTLHFFETTYPAWRDKMSVCVHPIPVGIRPPSARDDTSNDLTGRVIRCLMIGTINESNLDAASRMLRALGGRSDCLITIIGQSPSARLAGRDVDLKPIRCLGYVSDEVLLEELDGADICLLPHGLTGRYSLHEYRTIFPTRLVTYLAAGKVILAHCPDDSFLADFIRRWDCACAVSEPHEAAIAAAFEGLVASGEMRRRLRGNADAAAAQFDPARAVQSLTGSVAVHGVAA